MSRKRVIKAPFPAIGGKGSVAHLVWERFGNVDNYIEPFGNSLAVLLRNPNGPARKETVNDKDHYISNFWRAVRAEPARVAEEADWPVNETDMHARHKWLVASEAAAEFREKMINDPTYYDVRFAGWWAWGQCMWIGPGWCAGDNSMSLPRLHHEQGLNCKPEPHAKRPNLSAGHGTGTGVHARSHLVKQRPNLSAGHGTGTGVHGKAKYETKQVPRGAFFPGVLQSDSGLHAAARPQLGDAYARGRGVHSNDHANTCEERREWLVEWMTLLSDRLRNVRVCCGDWLRVCKSPTVTTRLGLTGVFLDPPYRLVLDSGKRNRDEVYATDRSQDLCKLNAAVRAWCVKRGDEKQMRIALCSYEGEGNEVLEAHGWQVMSWQSNGYGTTGKGKANAARERIWFSPHCLIPERDIMPLFAGIGDY